MSYNILCDYDYIPLLCLRNKRKIKLKKIDKNKIK